MGLSKNIVLFKKNILPCTNYRVKATPFRLVSTMNTILEIRNNRAAKVGERNDRSLPNPRKVNPIPPIHYTWNKNLAALKRNTILEIRNTSRPSIIDWKENTIPKRTVDLVQKTKKVHKFSSVKDLIHFLQNSCVFRDINGFYMSN